MSGATTLPGSENNASAAICGRSRGIPDSVVGGISGLGTGIGINSVGLGIFCPIFGIAK